MKKQVISLILTALAVLLLVVSCSDRGTNVPSASNDGVFAEGIDSHVFVDSVSNGQRQLLLQIGNAAANALQLRYYLPDSNVTTVPDKYKGKRMPVVILLAPQDADANFFFAHGIMQLANEMVANGTIRPMLIIMVPNDRVFGGYFYGNSDPAGYYDQIIGGTLVDYIENRAFFSFVIGDSAHRAIGGFGEGSYGAYRAALKHPGTFSVVATTDGPMDFDGASGNGGLIPLFAQAMTEQGLTAATYKNFDSSTAWPISRMLIGGSLAFSPHITQVRDSLVFTGGNPPRKTFLKVIDTIPDTMTLITGCIDGQVLGQGYVNPGVGNINWDFHLPFDGNGQPYRGNGDPASDVWGLWLANNLENLLTAAPGSLTGVKMWFATSQQAEYGYYDQTQSWIQTLQGNATYAPNVTVRPFNGYSGNPTTNNQYAYDVLREMLIFFSKSFPD